MSCLFSEWSLLVKNKILAPIMLFLKGIMVGIANIIPGVSGGTIAVIVGVFDRMLEALNTLFKKFKENMKFLIPLGLGAVFGILALSRIMEYCLVKFELPTNFFFVGLVIGSVPLIYKKVDDNITKVKPVYIIPFLIGAGSVIALSVVQTFFVNTEAVPTAAIPEMSVSTVVMFLLYGVIASVAMVIPGISGSLVMVLLGAYDKVIAAINGLTSFGDTQTMIESFLVLLPFGIGIVFGVFSVAKVFALLLKKFPGATYVAILGLMVGSCVALLINMELYTLSPSIIVILVSALTAVAGFFTSFFLGRE